MSPAPDRPVAPIDGGLWRRMVAYARPYRGSFAACLVLALATSAVELGVPRLHKAVVDGCFVSTDPAAVRWHRLDVIAGLYAAAIAVRYLLIYAQTNLMQRAGQAALRDLRRDIMARLLRLPVPYFDRNPVGRLVTRGTTDVAAINDLYAVALVNLARDAFMVAGVLVLMALKDWRLCLAAAALAPPLAWVSWEFRRRIAVAYRDYRGQIARLLAWLQERITGMRVVQAFAQEERSHREFAAINADEFRAGMRQLGIFAVFQPVVYLFGSTATAMMLWRGGLAVHGGAVTSGDLVQYLAYLEMLFAPIRDLADKYNLAQSAMAAAERIVELLDEPPEDPGRGLRPAACAGAIEFQDVWFAYRGEEWALRGVSFAVPAGGSAALVGATGSGKTTAINLLLRFREPQRGRILLDGVDLRELDVAWLRARLAVVLQDVFLFAGDIAANISLREPSIGAERIAAAARLAAADGFIAHLPGGFGTRVGERGAGFSAGERQLMAFARAVCADPRVLVLDEATANIDSRTEHLIQDSLARLLAGRTALVVAHRLSTIRRAGQILVLRQGEIAERGTHAELLAHGGLYAALHRSQTAEEALRGSADAPAPAPAPTPAPTSDDDPERLG